MIHHETQSKQEKVMKITQAKAVVEAAIKSALALSGSGARDSQYITPYLTSAPGLGKTSIVEQIADEMGLGLVILSLAQYDYSEIAGWNLPSEDRSHMISVRPAWMPTEGRGIVFLDELPQAPVSNQNIAAQIVNERRVGKHHMPEGWVVVAAGNRQSDRAGTNVMPSHLRDRLMFIEVEPDLEDTIAFFSKVGVSDKVRAYLRFRPEWLSKFDPQVNACPSPRSWDRVSTIIGWGIDPVVMTDTVAGQVGEAAAADFMGFLKMYDVAPDIDKLIANPDSAEVPEDAAVLFAVTAAISSRMSKANAGNCLKYMDRIPHKEFVAFAVKDAISRDADVKKADPVRKWIVSEGAALALA
jgi:hypothetical protein